MRTLVNWPRKRTRLGDAALPYGDPAAAKTLTDLGVRPWHTARMEQYWFLWNAIGDRTYLEDAWRILVNLRDNLPEESRVSLMEKVPLHREIAAAAKEAGL